MEGPEPSETIPKDVTEQETDKQLLPEVVSSEKVESKSNYNQDYVLAALTCLGLFVIMGMRCNLGPGFDTIYNKDFSLIPTAVVLIDGAFHVGYILTQIPAALLCYRYSANRLFISGVIASAFINLILPGAINLGSEFLMALRFLQGGLEGVVIPALYRVWGLTISETKAFLVSLAYSGCLLGFALSFPLSRCLSWKFSWEATFYFFGALAIIWCVIWSYFVREKSSKIHYRIFHVIVPSVKEHKPISVPYGAILKSRPLWALSSVTTSCLLSVYIFITTLNVYTPSPQYHFFTNEFTFSILCVVMCFALLITGWGSDFLFQHNILSLNTIRKITICGSVGLLLPVSLITHLTKIPILSTTGYSGSSFLFGCAICGILVNCLDLGKQFAALSSAFISFGSFLACMLIYIMKVQFSSHEKSNFSFIVFIAIVQIFGVFMYAVYGSSNDQHWDLPPPPIDFIEESCDEEKQSEAIVDVNVDLNEPTEDLPEDTKCLEVAFETETEETTEEESEVERLPVIVEGVEYHHKVEIQETDVVIEKKDEKGDVVEIIV